MNRNDKGALAEAQVIARFAELGCTAYTPTFHNSRADMIVDVDGHLLKVQVKFGRWMETGAVECHFVRNGTNVQNEYSADEVDLFAIYSERTEEVYVVPFEDAPATQVRLRVEEINQSTGGPKRRWAEDYVLNSTEGLSSYAAQEQGGGRYE